MAANAKICRIKPVNFMTPSRMGKREGPPPGIVPNGCHRKKGLQPAVSFKASMRYVNYNPLMTEIYPAIISI